MKKIDLILNEDIVLLKDILSRNKDKTIEIVLNKCYGSYGLSKKAYEYLGIEWDNYGCIYEEDRINPKLIEVVKVLKEEASMGCSQLEIEEIDMEDLLSLRIRSYDGFEKLDSREGDLILESYVK